MYRRLKNILGGSLMLLGVVVSQIPMPETRAGTVGEMTEMEVDDTSAHVVTFSLNGGTFKGSYNGYSFEEKTPVLVVDHGKTIGSFPDDRFAAYSGYRTEPDTWYTDPECLIEYDTGSSVNESMTLYKKWYNITSDGTTLSDKGFHISADGTVLYRYDGAEILVEIPPTVAVIAEGAFTDLAQEVREITLPAGLQRIEENAFDHIKNIVYIYDSDTAVSKEYGKKLADEYEQLVYSGYLDPEKTEQIVGIPYQGDPLQEADQKMPEDVELAAESGTTLSGSTGTAKKDTAVVPAEQKVSAAAVSAVQKASTAAVSALQEMKTTQNQTAVSASAPKSTQHIKDSTPKTGDPLQYRMLVVCAMFSVGVLLVLTGNGKKKRFAAS